MRQVSFYSPARDRFVCRETGTRFAILPYGHGFRVYINECPDVTRPTRREAIDRIEQEARFGLL